MDGIGQLQHSFTPGTTASPITKGHKRNVSNGSLPISIPLPKVELRRTHSAPEILTDSVVKKDTEIQEKVLKIEERVNIADLFHGFKNAHKTVEAGSPLKQLPDQKAPTDEKDAFISRYQKFLNRIYWDLMVLEPLLESTSEDPLIPNFSKLYRLKSLEKDIYTFKNMDGESLPADGLDAQVLTAEHRARYQTLADTSPYLLVPHACLRYYAILFGGLMRERSIKKVFNDHIPLNFYSFDKGIKPRALINKLTNTLKEISDQLTPEQYKLFHQELKTAWLYAADTVGVDRATLTFD